MQAVILAAGMGKRLGKLTQNNTKCMLKVHGISLIERSLAVLAAQKLTRTIIVVGYEGQNVIDLLGDSFHGMKLQYVWNHDYATTNNIYSLFLTEQYLSEEDTLLLESDLIFDAKIITELIANPLPNLAVVSKYESWMDGTVVCLDEKDNITRFIPKRFFSYKELDSYYKTVNIYKFSRQFLVNSYLPFLRAYSSAMGNSEYYEQVLRVVLALEKQDLKALRLHGEKWYEIDDVQDLSNAETIFAPEKDRHAALARRWGGYWRFPKIKDFCFLVNPYFPPPVMEEEMKTYFGSLLSGYPSGQSVQRLLAAKMFNCAPGQILVGNGAAELINALMSGLTGRVGVVTPTFHEYANRVGFENCKQLSALECSPDLSYSAQHIKQFCEDVDTFVLINPDNPSGNYLPKAEVLDLVAWFQQRGKRLILDESFVDFSNENAAGSFLNEADLTAFPSLVVIKSISKSYGIPGVRLGVLATADPAIMKHVERQISIWNINSFAEFVLQIIGKYERAYQAATARIRQERDRFGRELQKVNYLRMIPSQGNYFTCEVTTGFSAKQLAEALLTTREILIKDCTGKPGFGKGEYVRIAVRDTTDNDALLAALHQLAIGLN